MSNNEIKELKKENRINHMEYMEGMEILTSDIMTSVISKMNSYDYEKYDESDVRKALNAEVLSIEDFAALLSPAALPFLEDMAKRAKVETEKHFGNSINMFTPLYISNYCENYCIYCGFNKYNKIHRLKLDKKDVYKRQVIQGSVCTTVNAYRAK